MAGVPESMGDDCWMRWVNESIVAENEAQRQRQRIADQTTKHRPKGRR